MDLIRLFSTIGLGHTSLMKGVDTGPPGFGGPPLSVEGLQKEVAANEPKPQAQILDLLERILSTTTEKGSPQLEILANLGELKAKVETPEFSDLLAAMGIEVPAGAKVQSVAEFKKAIAGAALDSLVPAALRSDFAKLTQLVAAIEPLLVPAAPPVPFKQPASPIKSDTNGLAKAVGTIGSEIVGPPSITLTSDVVGPPIQTKLRLRLSARDNDGSLSHRQIGPPDQFGSFRPRPLGEPERIQPIDQRLIGPPFLIDSFKHRLVGPPESLIVPAPVGPPVQIDPINNPAPVGPPILVVSGVTPAPVGPPVQIESKDPLNKKHAAQSNAGERFAPIIEALRATEVKVMENVVTLEEKPLAEKSANSSKVSTTSDESDSTYTADQPDQSNMAAESDKAESSELNVSRPTATEKPQPVNDYKAIDRKTVDDIRQRVIDQVQEMVATRGNGRVTIRLNPEELGSITIAVTSIGESVETKITASNEQVRHSLHTHRADLIQTIESRGLTMNSFSVGHEANADQQGQQRQGHDARQDFARSHNLAQHSRHDETTRPTYTKFAHAGVDTLA